MEFQRRKEQIDVENESKRKSKEQERDKKKMDLEKQKQQLKAFAQNKKVLYQDPKDKPKGKTRGSDEEEESKFEISKGPQMEQYIGAVKKQTELFSTFDPDVIFETLQELADLKCLTNEPQRDKYKLKMMFMVTGEDKK